jgi:hypothetical protein
MRLISWTLWSGSEQYHLFEALICLYTGNNCHDCYECHDCCARHGSCVHTNVTVTTASASLSAVTAISTTSGDSLGRFYS